MLTALTIGNFDGVHRGHQALIHALANYKNAHSQNESVQIVAVTFEPHPAQVLRPEVPLHRLSNPQQKVELLRKQGVDLVEVIHFDEKFSRGSAREFFENSIVAKFKPNFISIGHDFYFGHNREGTPGKLIDWCEAHRIEATLVDPIESDGSPISSSRIRALIEKGDMMSSSRLLGRDYSIEGIVEHGDKRGRQIGFPTANVYPKVNGTNIPCTPAKGVYLSFCTIEGKTFPAVTNVGVKPTVQKNSPLVIESHLLGYQDNSVAVRDKNSVASRDKNSVASRDKNSVASRDLLYGKLVTVEFRDRLRDEKKFASIEQLTEQIREDVRIANERLRPS